MGPAEEDEEEGEVDRPAPTFLRSAIPFGPFISLAALEYLFFGEVLTAWYVEGVGGLLDSLIVRLLGL